MVAVLVLAAWLAVGGWMDSCATAVDVTNALPYSVTVEATTLTHDTGLPGGNGYGGTAEATVEYGAWFTITPATNKRVRITTDGSVQWTVIHVYSGSCGSLTFIDHNTGWGVGDGTPANPQSQARMTLDLTAGTTYYFLVGQLDGIGTSGNMSVQIQDWPYPLFRSINPVTGAPSSINVPGSPKGPTDGDLVFVFFTHKGSGYSSAQPSGFSLLEQQQSGDLFAELWVKTAASETVPGTYNFTVPGTTAAVGFAFAVRGNLDVHASRANAVAGSGCASITPTYPYSYIFTLAAHADNIGFSAHATGAPGSLTFEEIEDAGTTSGTDSQVGLGAITMTPAGATGASSWSGTSLETIGMLLAVGMPATASYESPDLPVDDSVGCCGKDGVEGSGVAAPGAGAPGVSDDAPPMRPGWTPRCAGRGIVATAADVPDGERWA